MTPRAAPDAPPRSRKSAKGWRRKLRKWLRDHALPVLGPPLVRALHATWRVDFDDEERARRIIADGAIFTLWHGRMLLAMPANRDNGIVVLVSPSGDGEVSMKLLRRFGFAAVRGSTSQGGMQALRKLIADLGSGRSLALTPDGPRGPMHSVNEGAAYLSAVSGRPIGCAGLVADRAWRLSSWDRFTIPKPFARVAITLREPFRVESDDRATIARATERVREELLAAERESAARLGVEADA